MKIVNETNNSILSKPFMITFLYRQNNHHKHGVFLHTMKVVYHVLVNKDFKFLTAAFLHDIGKPVVAYQNEEDVRDSKWSFIDHEEKSYQIVKDWTFLSQYTKNIIRYHYLIRDIHLSKLKGNIDRHDIKKKIWDTLDEDLQTDLEQFLIYDDLGKF